MTNAPSNRKRSWELTLFAACYLAISASGWLRLGQALDGWDWLVAFATPPGPRYIAISGGVVGLLALVAAVWVWARWRGGSIAAGVAALLHAAWFWWDRIEFTRSTTTQVAQPFLIGLTIFWLLFVGIAIFAPQVRS